jgi:hypothetical protein
VNITQLEAKRRAAQRQVDAALAPQRQKELAEAELVDIEQQIAEARQQADADRLAAQQRENAIAATEIEHARLADIWHCYRLPLEEWARRWHRNQFARAELGIPDLGDIVFSAAAVIAPILERDQGAYAATRAMMGHDRQSDSAAEAWRERQALIQRLHIEARPWPEAEQLADQVERGDLTEEEAFASLREETEDVEV